ncbi:MAG: hypothetical protein JRE24_07420 [Deltaproteobacteria bacterium]|nr:hypothetical protein [Deltaproteobacteria bacterium]
MDECANNQYATARCRPEAEADNRVVAEGEDGYFYWGPRVYPWGSMWPFGYTFFPTYDQCMFLIFVRFCVKRH